MGGGAGLRRDWAPYPAAVTLLTFAANRALGPVITSALGNILRPYSRLVLLCSYWASRCAMPRSAVCW